MGENLKLHHGTGWKAGEEVDSHMRYKRRKVPNACARLANESSLPIEHHEAVHAPSYASEILDGMKLEWHRRCEGDECDELEGDDLRAMSRMAWRASEEVLGQGGDEVLVRLLSKAFLESIDKQGLGCPSMSWASFVEEWTKAVTIRASSALASLHLSRAVQYSKIHLGADGGVHQAVDELMVASLFFCAVECAVTSKGGGEESRQWDTDGGDRLALRSSRACLTLLKGIGSSKPLPLAPRVLASSLQGLCSLLTHSPQSMEDLNTAEDILIAASSVCDWAAAAAAGGGLDRFSLMAEEGLLPLKQRPLEMIALTRLIREKHAMLYCQLGRDDEAASLLLSEGYSYRLTRSVLRYQIKNPHPAASVLEESQQYVCAVDDALPSEMLNTMRAAFDPQSPFWSEHDYHLSSPYFSYVHPLESTSQCGLDHIIRHIYSVACSLFPSAKGARFAEWWAHCRPHGSGHQLHFDSDNEGIGHVRNPNVSSVLYSTSEGLGGHTLVTDQSFSSRLAKVGYFVTPRIGRLAVFDGSVLHGVVPGRLGDEERDRVCEGEEGSPMAVASGLGLRRVTFMVAFWGDIRIQPRSDDLPGASQLFHTSGASSSSVPQGRPGGENGHPGRDCFGPSLKPSWDHTWKQSFTGFTTIPSALNSQPSLSEVCPVRVDKVWDILKPKTVHAYEDELLQKLPAYSDCFQGF